MAQNWRTGVTVEEEEELMLNEDVPAPFDQLRSPKPDALACQPSNGVPCPQKFISTNVVKMMEHCRLEHGWVNAQRNGQRISNGRGSTTPVRPWRTDVHCQYFWKHGRGGTWFEVAAPSASSTSDHTQTSGHAPSHQSAEDWWNAQIARADIEISARQRRRIDEGDQKLEVSPWLQRMGAARHLSHLNREELIEALKPPSEDDGLLYTIGEGFKRCIVRAQGICIRSGHLALMEINRKEATTTSRSRPFEARMEAKSFKGYQRIWLSLICYVFRTISWNQEERPDYKTTKQQERALDHLTQAAQAVMDFDISSEFVDDFSSDPDSDVEGGDSDLPENGDDLRRQRRRLKLMDEVARRCQRLCVAMLDHELKDHESKSGLVSGMMALSLKSDGGYQDPDDYTPKLSAAVKLARMMVLTAAHDEREAKRKKMEDDRCSEEQTEELLKGHVEYVRVMVNRFMTLFQGGQRHRHPSPMNWIFQLRTYGFVIRYNTTAAGVIDWGGVDRDIILYQQIQMKMSAFRETVHGLVEETRHELFEDLMLLDLDEHGDQTGDVRAPRVDWGWVDDASKRDVGWTFLDDPRNRFPLTGRTWLRQRVCREDRLRRQFLNSDESFRPSRLEEYGRKIGSFLEKMGFFFLNVGGGCPRIPELLSVRFRNSANGGVRNITLDHGLVRYVTAYDKTYRTRGKMKIVHRYLPREVGELLVWYLWLVLPFWEDLQKVAYGRREFSPFLWRRQDEEPADEGYESEDRDDMLAPGQSWDKVWNSERVKRVLKGIYHRNIGFEVGVSANRQMMVGIQRKYLQMGDPESQEPLDDDIAEELDLGERSFSTYVDKSHGHGPTLAANLYARDLREAPNETERERVYYCDVSRRLHQWLGFASAATAGTKRKRMQLDDRVRSAQLDRWKRMRHVNIFETLDSLLGDGSNFRGVQEKSIDAIMRGKPRILTVMGTGAGKSMLFMLPAKAMPDGMTVVIVPLISLRGDLQGRCQKADIACVEWDGQHSVDMASIVFVTPEGALSKTFATYLNRIQGQGRLDRIVIDECHTVLDASADFRPRMREIGRAMAARGVQMVYLTATLPPRRVAEFYRLMGLEGCPVEEFRAATTRKNVRYRVRTCTGEESEVDAADAEVRSLMERYVAPAKIIVYTDSIAHGKELAGKLSCPIFHAKAGSVAEKEAMFRRFTTGADRVMVATNALGLGVDVPDIRAVLHLGRPRQLDQYGQESGRAGRDGEKSEAIVVTRARGGSGGYGSARPGAIEADDLELFLSVSGCQRVVLDRVMDGREDRVECEEGEQKCAWCWREERLRALIEMTGSGPDQPSHQGSDFDDSGIVMDVGVESSPPPSSQTEDALLEVDFERQQRQLESFRQKAIELQRVDGFEVHRLRQFLDEMSGCCIWCVLTRHPDGDWRDHDWSSCEKDWQREKEPLRRSIDETVRKVDDNRFKRQIMALYNGCWFCGLPQDICNRWEKGDHGFVHRSRGRCQYGLMVFEAVLLAFQWQAFMDPLRLWIFHEGLAGGQEVDFNNDRSFLSWLGKKWMWGRMETNHWTKVYYRLMEIATDDWRGWTLEPSAG